MLYSRSNLFFASDFILFLPPFFEQCHNRALSTQSLSASHIAQEPSWRFTAHSFLRPGRQAGIFSEPPLARNSRFAFASRLPRLRPCSPEIRKKSRLFCRLLLTRQYTETPELCSMRCGDEFGLELNWNGALNPVL